MIICFFALKGFSEERNEERGKITTLYAGYFVV